MAATWVQDWAWAFATGAWALWAIAAIILWFALFKDRSRGRRRCPRCWYDMTGVPGLKCPECGREAKREKRLFSTRRRWRLAAFGVALALVGIASHRAPIGLRHGVWAAVPIPVLNFVLGFWEKEATAFYWQEVNLGITGNAFVQPVRSPWQRLQLASAMQVVPEHMEERNPFGTMTSPLSEFLMLSSLGIHLRPAIPKLERALHAYSTETRHNAIHLLGVCAAGGSTEAAELLDRTLQTARDQQDRMAAFEALVLGAPSQIELRRILERAVWRQDSERVAYMVAASLAGTLGNSSSDQKVFASLLKHSFAGVRQAAVEHLQPPLRPAPVPTWAVVLVADRMSNDPDAIVRSAAVLAAERLDLTHSGWSKACANALRDSDSEVRLAAARFVCKRASELHDARELVLREAAENPDARLRAVLLNGVAQSSLPIDVKWLALGRAMTEDPAPEPKAVATRALYFIVDDRAAHARDATDRLGDESPYVQLAALNVLGRMGPLAASALDRIRELESSPDPRIAAAARAAREKIEGR